MNTFHRALLGGIALALITAAQAAPARRFYADLALSPDGRWVASVEGTTSPPGGPAPVRELHIRSTNGQSDQIVPLPCGAVPDCQPSALTWTPDGQNLTFAVKAPGGLARSLYQADAKGQNVRRLLAFDGTIESLKYAPNGALAMLATAGATKEVGAAQAGAPTTGDLDAATPKQSLAVLEPGSNALRWISGPDLHVYEYDWMPDGSGWVGTAALGDGDRNWWIAQLYRFSNQGKPAHVLYRPQNAREQLANPRVSPDGNQVALIVGLMSDFGVTGGDLVTLPTAGGVPTNLTAGSKSTVTAVDWGCDAHLRALVLAQDQIQRVDFGADSGAGRAGKLLWTSRDKVDNFETASHCSNPMDVSLRESYVRAPEIQVGTAGQWRDLTNLNAHLSVNFTAQSLRWTNDGMDIQGWLLLPAARADQAAKLPMVVAVHGGPAWAFQPTFMGGGAWRALLDHGYAMFLPNPRGSFGQGSAFQQANVRDFGGGDLRDILAGVDAVIQRHPIDPQRLGLTGHSYGGFMTMWAVTQTQRFKAAVAGAGIANWQSYYGQNGISEWMPPFFGDTVYGDPAVYAKSSPINFIRNVNTPTFSYVGEADIECPPAQTQEFGRALQILGKPSMTVIYPGEGHRLRKPATLADVEQRTLAWFDRYLK